MQMYKSTVMVPRCA